MSLEVHVGRDGWLFLTGGSNNVWRLYNDPSFFSDELARGWQELMLQRSAKFAECGIRFLQMIVPDKISVLPEYVTLTADSFDSHPLARLHALQDPELEAVLVDPTDVLRDQTPERLNFFKTDSHWTVWGAQKAYNLLCRRLGFEPPVDVTNRRVGNWPVAFDLGSKLEPQVHEHHIYIAPVEQVRRVHSNEIVVQTEKVEQEGGHPPPHHGSSVIFKAEGPNVRPETLVLFGDSFSDYRPSTFTYLLAETFAETHFVWNNRVDFEYAQHHHAHIVISEIAERFTTLLPVDPFNVDAYVQERMAEYWRAVQPEQG